MAAILYPTINTPIMYALSMTRIDLLDLLDEQKTAAFTVDQQFDQQFGYFFSLS